MYKMYKILALQRHKIPEIETKYFNRCITLVQSSKSNEMIFIEEGNMEITKK
jgi:hypothetical protein